MVEAKNRTISDMIINGCRGNFLDNYKWERAKRSNVSFTLAKCQWWTVVGCMQNVIPRVFTKKVIQWNILKTLQINQNGNKKCSRNLHEYWKKNQLKLKQKDETK